jgi:hypothetical protein
MVLIRTCSPIRRCSASRRRAALSRLFAGRRLGVRRDAAQLAQEHADGDGPASGQPAQPRGEVVVAAGVDAGLGGVAPAELLDEIARDPRSLEVLVDRAGMDGPSDRPRV